MKITYIGHIVCANCGFNYITDPEQVTIWLVPDAQQQYAEVTCSGCSAIVSGRLDHSDLLIFQSHGVEFRDLNEKFSTLTEKEISEWKIEKELKTLAEFS